MKQPKIIVPGRKYLFMAFGFELKIEVVKMYENRTKCSFKILEIMNKEEVKNSIFKRGIEELIASGDISEPTLITNLLKI